MVKSGHSFANLTIAPIFAVRLKKPLWQITNQQRKESGQMRQNE